MPCFLQERAQLSALNTVGMLGIRCNLPLSVPEKGGNKSCQKVHRPLFRLLGGKCKYISLPTINLLCLVLVNYSFRLIILILLYLQELINHLLL
ncbi:hypothetical protein Barb6_02831 [Bacteroidales bacterium Barb6]|nr:hypothetical protein Barb6_02831 [Bacteroidales bacterium Barb6]